MLVAKRGARFPLARACRRKSFQPCGSLDVSGFDSNGTSMLNFRNRDDVKYGKLRLIDVPHEIAANEPWFNQTLTTVNGAVVRMGVFQGDFPWHKHDNQDEFFLVLEGEMWMDVQGREPVLLRQHQGFTVPRGVVHRPRSPEKSAVLMVEEIGIKPTGD
jgi:mannose-6-phosphate isomerase-like protein (cupin superfamily)